VPEENSLLLLAFRFRLLLLQLRNCRLLAFLSQVIREHFGINRVDRLRGTHLDAGWPLRPVDAKIAFIRFDGGIDRGRPPFLNGCLASHDFHRSIGTGHHTALAADAARLNHLNGVVAVDERPGWAHLRARRILALAALNRSADPGSFHDLKPWNKMGGSEFIQGIGRGMSQNARHLARPAPDAFPRIRNHQYVHQFTLQLLC
jgi:hypothetical protein